MSGFFDPKERMAAIVEAGRVETAEIYAASSADREAKREAERDARQAWIDGMPEGALVLVQAPLGPCASGCGKSVSPAHYAYKIDGVWYRQECVGVDERCVCGGVTHTRAALPVPRVERSAPCEEHYPLYLLASRFTGWLMPPLPIPRGFRKTGGSGGL